MKTTRRASKKLRVVKNADGPATSVPKTLNVGKARLLTVAEGIKDVNIHYLV